MARGFGTPYLEPVGTETVGTSRWESNRPRFGFYGWEPFGIEPNWGLHDHGRTRFNGLRTGVHKELGLGLPPMVLSSYL